MNADQWGWLTERVLGAVFEVNTSARGPANAPDPEGTPVAAPIGVSRSSTFVSRTTLHIAIHDKVVLNSSMGNQPENIEEPTGSGDPFHVEEISTGIRRSEEHTSELQSLRHLVCRLLLEKKKTNIKKSQTSAATIVGSETDGETATE